MKTEARHDRTRYDFIKLAKIILRLLGKFLSDLFNYMCMIQTPQDSIKTCSQGVNNLKYSSRLCLDHGRKAGLNYDYIKIKIKIVKTLKD